MDKLGDPFQIFSVASASDQAHQTDYIVNKPETSASPKTVCSFDESVGNHEHFELRNLLGARCQPVKKFSRDVCHECFARPG